MLCSPTQTCFWAGRLTPAIRAMTRSPNLVAAGVFDPAREHEILAGSRGTWKSRTKMVRNPAWGVCPCSGDGIRTARPLRRTPPGPCPARYSGARSGPDPPAHGTVGRVALVDPGETRAGCGSGRAASAVLLSGR